MSDSLALDIGHSTVKGAAGKTKFIFPTAACPAVTLSVDGASSAAKTDTVRVGSDNYFVGETAVIHSGGRLLDGLSDNWIESPEHSALLLAGYQKGVHALGTDSINLVLGLPSRLHGAQKNRLREIAAMTLQLPKEQISVIPQPLGAYYTLIIDEDGQPTPMIDSDHRWLQIDVGHYTADFGMVVNGVWSAAGAESVDGTHVAASNLKRLIAEKHGLDLTVRQCDEILRTKSLRDQGEVIDLTALVEQATLPMARSIVEYAVRHFGDSNLRSQVDGILVAGGGASLIFDEMKKTWRHARCADNSRFAVAEGLRRYGLALAA